MKQLLNYMSRHHEDLEKSISDEHKEIFDKFHDCESEYISLGEAAIFEYAFKLGIKETKRCLKNGKRRKIKRKNDFIGTDRSARGGLFIPLFLLNRNNCSLIFAKYIDIIPETRYNVSCKIVFS